MRNVDEISVQFWHDNKFRIKAKSYSCLHNGNIYGDNMLYDDIFIIYSENNKEIIFHEKDARKMYLKFLEYICNKSEEVFFKFSTAKADKYKIFSEDEVLNMSKSRKGSTHIKINDDNSVIYINHKKYYVAKNLKICEYFNAISNSLTEEHRINTYIRIMKNVEKSDNSLKDADELVPIENGLFGDFKIIISDEISLKKSKHKKSTKIDYIKLNEKKKNIGDFGEYLVIQYEKNKLLAQGMDKLANEIEHTSIVVGDNEGYDIKSFTTNGEELYIEVKSTQRDISGGFYISHNEINVAKKLYEEGKLYRIYRLYKIDKISGSAFLKIYSPPFDEINYTMQPISWYVENEKMK